MTPESDGYTEAWFLPKLISEDDKATFTNGNWFDTFKPTFHPDQVCLAGQDEGLESNTYTNDQPSSTLFYHDHSLGMTRLNVMAAG